MFGNAWRKMFTSSYARALSKSPCFDMFSVQPMLQPIGIVGFYRSSYVPTSDPEIRLDLVHETVTARNYGLSSKLLVLPKVVPDDQSRQVLLDALLLTVVEERVRNVLGSLRYQALQNNVLEMLAAPDDVAPAVTVRQALSDIFSRTMRGAANNVLVNDAHLSDLASLKDVAFVHSDSLFQKGEALVWFNGKSYRDATVVWAPYLINFMCSVTPVDGEPQEIRFSFIDNVTIVSPQGALVVPISLQPVT